VYDTQYIVNGKRKKESEVERQLNISRLIQDVGGASKAAEDAGVVRTAPYGWVKRNYVSSVILEKLITANPNIKLDDYFELMEEDSERDDIGMCS
tara:strand:+ start:106 stop:390 length:285 start_codon:yes stop_codon:yes gene_type:complete